MSEIQEEAQSWLMDVLGGGPVVRWPARESDVAAALRAAARHGVVSLIHRELFAGSCSRQCPASLLAAFAGAAHIEVAKGLLHFKECRRVIGLLQAAGIPALFLKGSALAAWLYPARYLRECGDIDLLLGSQGDVEKALDVLALAGFEAPVRTISGELVCYELMCIDTTRGYAGIEVDLHWRLCNTPLFCDVFSWSELHGAAISLPGLGGDGFGLSPIHALAHACLHRAHNLQFGDGDSLRWLYDLKLLSQAFGCSEWQQFLSLAVERGIAGPCAHGLLAARGKLGVELPEFVLTDLVASARSERLNMARMHRWLYAQWVTGRSIPTWRLRLRWLRQRLLPNPVHLRELYRAEGWGLVRILWTRLGRAADRIRAAP